MSHALFGEGRGKDIFRAMYVTVWYSAILKCVTSDRVDKIYYDSEKRWAKRGGPKEKIYIMSKPIRWYLQRQPYTVVDVG